LTLPNVITLFRLILVPLAVWLILDARFWLAFWVFLAAGVSDAIDGWIARRFDLRSELGALLDPLADKALLMSVYVTLGAIRALPLWLVILVVARDVMIMGGFLLLGVLGHAPTVRPLAVSKLNTALQIVLAAATLVRLGGGWDLGPALDALVAAAGLTTFVSGAAYLVQWSREQSRGAGGT
jgi:cardiolipin synthase